MTATEPVPAWTVTGQREAYRTVDGVPTVSWVVSFKTAGGVTASVDVATADYTPDKVAAMINERAAAIDAVHALQGPPTT